MPPPPTRRNTSAEQPHAVVLFDIDGVIRDVSASYRRAIVETVHHYGGWRPEPAAIDALKSEGTWNNDWQASRELLRRAGLAPLPELATLAEVFSGFYFGGDPEGDPQQWRGFIGDEPLLVEADFFRQLGTAGLAWGFVSGAEPASVRFVLQRRLGLVDPPFLAMGDAPDKPDPSGLLQLAGALLSPAGLSLGPTAPPVLYVGDTVADVLTVQRARQACAGQRFLALGVAPPHLQGQRRLAHEQQLRQAGADAVLPATATLQSVLPDVLAAATAGAPLSAPSRLAP